MMAGGALRFAPRLTLLLMAGPVIAGLAGTLRPAFETDGMARLLDWPGLLRAVALSFGTGMASTLLALNRLWKTGLSRSQLAAIGLQLGADGPFFLLGQHAWVEGVGDLAHREARDGALDGGAAGRAGGGAGHA